MHTLATYTLSETRFGVYKKKNKVQKYIFPVCQILIEHLLKINVLQVIASSGKGSSFFQTVKNILFGIQKYKVINFVTLI